MTNLDDKILKIIRLAKNANTDWAGKMEGVLGLSESTSQYIDEVVRHANAVSALGLMLRVDNRITESTGQMLQSVLEVIETEEPNTEVTDEPREEPRDEEASGED